MDEEKKLLGIWTHGTLGRGLKNGSGALQARLGPILRQHHNSINAKDSVMGLMEYELRTSQPGTHRRDNGSRVPYQPSILREMFR